MSGCTRYYMVSSSPTKTFGSVLKWVDLLNESVHTSDDQDIGDIEAINREFVVVKRGFINVHRYYIPSNQIEGWDGNVVWLKINEEEVKSKYQKDDVPDPSRYLIKDYENYYRYAVYPPIEWTRARYVSPPYPVPLANLDEHPLVYKCDLCNAMFKDDQELSKHVSTSH
jgi:hypothetical protein